MVNEESPVEYAGDGQFLNSSTEGLTKLAEAIAALLEIGILVETGTSGGQ